jgi:hypothetical protein
MELGAVATGSSASAPAKRLTTYILWGRFGLLRKIAATTALVAASGGEDINAVDLYIDDGCTVG